MSAENSELDKVARDDGQRVNNAAQAGEDISRRPQFDVRASSIGHVLVLTVLGDLDAFTAPELAEAISASLAEQRAALIVDLSEVGFLGSAGMTVLVDANEAAGSARRFAVVAEGQITGRPMEIVGLDRVLSIYPTLDDALAAAT